MCFDRLKLGKRQAREKYSRGSRQDKKQSTITEHPVSDYLPSSKPTQFFSIETLDPQQRGSLYHIPTNGVSIERAR